MKLKFIAISSLFAIFSITFSLKKTEDTRSKHYIILLFQITGAILIITLILLIINFYINYKEKSLSVVSYSSPIQHKMLSPDPEPIILNSTTLNLVENLDPAMFYQLTPYKIDKIKSKISQSERKLKPRKLVFS